MKLCHTLIRFLAYVKGAGYEQDELTPAVGLDLFFDFYWQYEAEECERDGMGDRLEFRYGTYAWDGGAFFEVQAVREMIDSDEDAGGVYRLTLTFRFPAAAGAGAGGDELLCDFPDELPVYRQEVMRSPGVAAVGRTVPLSVDVQFGKASG